MIVMIKQIILFLWIFCLPGQAVFSQHSSRNNYTGAWETPESWVPAWPEPQINISGYDITINGYITLNSSLTFSGSASNLIINDTLVINGNLTLDNNNDVTINDNGVLIIRGNLTINNQTINTANGYLIITGDIIKTGTTNQGGFTSNDTPVKVFVGGTISSAITTDPNYSALNCSAPPDPYPSSNCSYGNMTDLSNDPIFSFFQSTCTIASANSNSPLCAGNTIVLTSSGGTSYIWSGPNGFTSSAQNPTILNAGTDMTGIYTVTVTAAAGCTVIATTSVTVNALPATPTITAGGPTTFCDGESVTLTSSAATSYLWSTGATTASINVTSAGSYTVQVTNASGCQSTASVATIVTVNALPATPTITAGGPTTFCEGGSVNLTSSAGSTYLWSTGATTASINISTSGSYTVRVTNANGCQSALSAATTVTVNALPAAPTIIAGGPTTFCEGGSVNLTSSAGSTYLWSTGAATASINVSTSGSYTVQVTNANGCQSALSAATTVTVNALPAAPTITAGGPTTFCDGGSVTLTSSAGTSYLWSTGATTASINVTVSGSFTVRVTDVNGCQSAQSAATSVTVNVLPATPTIAAGGTTTFCEGGSVTLTSSAGTTYLWSTGATTASINVTVSGSYTVQVTNINGCQSAPSAATAVTVNALPATPTITAGGPTNFCEGESVTLTSSAGTTYLWSTGATTAGINVTTAGSYTVQVTNASGCQSAASAATVVVINALPVVYAGTDATIPNGTSTTIDATVTGIGPFTFSWSPTGLLTDALIEDPTTVNLSITTIFTLTATSATTTCSNSNTVIITISGGPLSSTPEATPGTVCAGENVQLHALASGGSGSYTYTWTSAPAGFTSAVADPIANPEVNTTYYVLVDDGFSTVNSQIDVTVNPLPVTPTITADGPITFCEGGSVTLTSSAETSYLWSTGATTANIDVTTAGSYTVQVTNTNGCQSASSLTTVVTVNDLPATPTITADGPTTFCAGGSVTLTSSAATSYLWSTGATTASINVTTAGSYTVQVTNAEGCLSAPSTGTVVTVNALPATPTITTGGLTTFCNGGSVNLTSSAGSVYLWSTAATTASINVSTSGSYTVRVTNVNGCQSAPSAATEVTVNALPATPTITTSGPTTFCDDGSVTLTSSTATSYLWSTGTTTASINVTVSGSYTVRVTNANGCQSAPSAATAVTVNALPATPVITAGGPTTFCDGGNVTLTSSVGSTYLWSNAETTADINVTTAGSYTVQVTNAEGCQSAPSTATAVTVNALPAIPTITAGGPTTFCEGGSVTLTSSTGTTYLWSTGATTASINVTTAGSYTVQVTNASGCQSSSSTATAVTVNALPATPAITAGGPTILCDGGSVNLTSSAGSTYLWSTGATAASINVTTSGNYTVQVTNANGCQSALSAATSVTVNALPATPTITTGGPTTFCDGGSVTLTSSAGSTYLWSNEETTQNINVTISGSYTVRVTNANGCQSVQSAATVVTVNALPLVSITSSSNTMCINDLRTLSGTPAGGTFDIIDGPGTVSGNVLSATGTGTINIEYSYTNVCTNKTTQGIIVNENPVAVAGPDQELTFIFETQLTAELSLSETGEWSLVSGSGQISDIHSPITMVTDLSIGENIFLWTVRNGNCDASKEVKITVSDLFVPSVITPNGDGKNDYFKINALNVRTELIIFNRWGNVEYTNSNYQNDWDGRNDNGNDMTNDTYYYILKFENGLIKKGTVLITR